MTQFETRQARLKRNHENLIRLAIDTIFQNPYIEVYLHKNHQNENISGIYFFNGEMYNKVQFHEVPYRWSGCGFGEFYKSNNSSEMPFTPSDVLSTMIDIKTVQKQHKTFFKGKKEFLTWFSWLVKLEL